MSQPLRPGTVIITGGSRGIGAETVVLCAQAGYDVLFTYVANHGRAAQLVQRCADLPGRVQAMQADARDTARAGEVLQRALQLGRLAGLVNNVGITSRIGSFLDLDMAVARDVMEVNVIGLMALCQICVRHWVEGGQRGSIVNLSSLAAASGAPHEYIHYAGSKGAVEAFTLGLAREFAARGIRANVVSPGTTETEIHASSGEPGRAQRVAARLPMQRVAQAQEVAQAVLWLLSQQASYVSGTVLKVTGAA
ncbi:SDR family oxidoreductase [Bordetella trematum]|uniref:SDR family oxidoreductase n=1 Tax=Bordetella trematum TaxID=123899 RepID=UPI003AF370FD